MIASATWRALFADRDLTDDRLVAALAIAGLDSDGEDITVATLARLVFPCPPHAHGLAWGFAAERRITAALAADAPRYETPTAPGQCSAPVAVRANLHDEPVYDACGRAVTGPGVTITDLADGTQLHIRVCDDPLHQDWMLSWSADNVEELQAGGEVPVPAANVGGALARHFPHLPWEQLYAAARPDWTPPPTVRHASLVALDPADPGSPVIARISPGHLSLVK